MKKSHLQSAFTLIETLVAIAILMVAIAGPLNIAEKALVTAVSSRDETIASYLAQDLMEYVKNVGDSNLLASRAWLAGISQCTTSSPCVSETSGTANPPATINGSSCSLTTGTLSFNTSCRLYIDATNRYYTYNSSSQNQSTQFYRLFTLTPLDNASLTSANVALLTVSVYWTNGTILNKVILQSIIFNVQR